jgi:large subunit ribosomal protein L31
MSNEDVFITKSAAETRETITVDGVEYPVVKLEISRTSHPFTQENKLIDTAGLNIKLNTLTLNNIACFQLSHAISVAFLFLFI